MTAFLTFVLVSAQLTSLKIGPVKIDEFFLPLALLIAVGQLSLQGWRLNLFRDARVLAGNYLLWGALVAVLSIVDLYDQTFSIPAEASALNVAGIVTLARLVQIGFAVGVMLAIYQACVGNDAALHRYVKIYIYWSVAVAVYAIACALLHVTSANPLLKSLSGAYSAGDTSAVAGAASPAAAAAATTDTGFAFRARGFFNEGGPYGVFLFTVVMLLLIARYHLRILSRRAFWFCASVIFVAFVMSASKAGMAALGAALVLGATVSRLSFRYRMLLLVLLAIGAGVIASTSIAKRAVVYFTVAVTLDESRGQVGALVPQGGRPAGLVIAPRMIAENPLTGVGLGNYPIVRNTPSYLQGMRPVEYYDLSGVGLLETAAEVGVPMFLYLAALLLWPYLRARGGSIPPLLAMAAPTQFLCHALGVQLTFIYPWIASGLILACIARVPVPARPMQRSRAEPRVPLNDLRPTVV